MHGFSSATIVHDISEDDDGRPVIILYVGDFDPSGMYMSKADLPKRFDKYSGSHVEVRRIALTDKQVSGLPSFPPPTSARTRASSGSLRITATRAISMRAGGRWSMPAAR